MTTTRGRFDYRVPEHHADFIGRRDRFGRWQASEWRNPFLIPRDGTRDDVVGLFATYLHCERPDLMARIGERRGRCQRCFCEPDQLCHGDVLVALAREAAPAEDVPS